MKNTAHPTLMSRANIARELSAITRGSRVVVSYAKKDGEHGSAIGTITSYEATAQGREALASQGEIKPSPYVQAEGMPFGILALKKDPAKLYLGFQKMVRDGGKFAAGQWRTLSLDGIQAIRIYGKRKVKV